MILNSKTTKLLLLSSALFLAGIGVATAATYSSLTTTGPNTLGTTNGTPSDDTYMSQLFASEIDANSGSTTNFSGNVSVTPGKLFLTNEINPVDCNGDEYDAGTTTMSGNFQVDGSTTFDKNVTINTESTVYTNEIDPASGDSIHFSGDVAIDHDHKLLVNEIDPLDNNNDEYDSGTLKLSATTAINPNYKLLVNEINPVDSNYDEYDSATISLSGTTAINPSKKLLVNQIDAHSGALRISGGVAFNPDASLLVNEINPVKFCGDSYVENDCGITHLSGDVRIDSLYVNEINALDHSVPVNFSNDVVVDNNAYIRGTLSSSSLTANSGVVDNLNALGETVNNNLIVSETLAGNLIEVGNDASVEGDATVYGELLVNKIKPFDCETIAFSESVAVNPQGILFVNEINPVSVECNNLVEDDNGTLQFSGTTAVHPNRKFLVNEINPVKRVGNKYVADDCATLRLSGTTAINPCRRLLVNEINPVNFDDGNYVEDDNGTISFSGTTAINPEQALLVNEINPVQFVVARGGVDCENVVPPYIADDAACAQTHFSGDLAIRNTRLFGQLDNVILYNDPNDTLDSTVTTSVLQINFDDGSDIAGAHGAYIRLHFIGKLQTSLYPQGNEADILSEVDFFVYPHNGVGAGSNTGNDGDSGALPGENPEFLVSGKVADIDSAFHFRGSSGCCTDSNNSCLIYLTGSLDSSGSSVDIGDTPRMVGSIYYEVISDNLVSACAPTCTPAACSS